MSKEYNYRSIETYFSENYPDIVFETFDLKNEAVRFVRLYI